MNKISGTIDRSIDTVWEYFTSVANLAKWPGGDLNKVVPGWQTGGKLYWVTGEPSTIGELKVKKTGFTRFAVIKRHLFLERRTAAGFEE